MIIFIIILCTLWFSIGIMFYVAYEYGASGASFLIIVVGALSSLIVVGMFCIIKGDNYFHPVYRKGDSVVYRDTQYGRVDTIIYIINKDTVYYGEINNN